MFIHKFKLLSIKCGPMVKTQRSLTEYKSHCELFTNYFKMPERTANDYIKNNRLEKIQLENIAKSIDFCKELCFANKSLLENPILLRANPLTLEQYYLVMTEAGFQEITPKALSKFRTYSNRRIVYLKEMKLIAPDTDVIQRFISCLDPRPENFSVSNELGDFALFQKVHLKVFTTYLAWRLQASPEQIQKLLATHKNVCNKSFRFLCENIAIAEDLGFTPEKILKYGYLVQGYPKYTKTLLEKFPYIAGASMRKAMRMYPKLVSTSPSNVEKIYNILKEHNIPDEAIQKRMNVFHLSPSTVKYRLEELKRISDFKVLLPNPGILKLVVHHNRAKSRLSFLKQLHLKCSGVTVLGSDDSKFHDHVREGRDTNTVTDTCNFIKGLFKNPSVDLEATLKKHPFYLQVPFTSMEDTHNYLISNKFTSDAILNVLYILLYPKNKIEDALKQVNSLQRKKQAVFPQTTQLQLVLYFIEKEHHFTGNGIWEKSEADELQSSEI